MNNIKKHKFITRMDYRATHGYNVRLLLPNGKTLSKLFSDFKLGGKRKALSSATVYRDKWIRSLNIKHKLYEHSNLHGPRKHFKISKTGIIGVIQTVEYTSCSTLYYWKGYYWSRRDGAIRGKTFSINKYGDCVAFQKACKVRFDECGTLYIYKKRFVNFAPCYIPRGVDYKFIEEL